MRGDRQNNKHTYTQLGKRRENYKFVIAMKRIKIEQGAWSQHCGVDDGIVAVTILS